MTALMVLPEKAAKQMLRGLFHYSDSDSTLRFGPLFFLGFPVRVNEGKRFVNHIQALMQPSLISGGTHQRKQGRRKRRGME